MKRNFAVLAGAATLWCTAIGMTASASIAAPSATAATSYSTEMQQTQPVPSGGVYAGVLRVSMSSEGIVSGWYLPADAGNVEIVTGGKSGSKVWMEIGNTNPVRIDAMLQRDGSIVGSARTLGDTVLSPIDMPIIFSFVAKPQAGGATTL